MILVVAAIPAQAQESAPTVGDMLIEIAGAKKMEAMSPEHAATSLRAAGFDVPQESLDRSLTEGRVVEIAALFGIRVTTRSPDAAFGKTELGLFMSAFGAQLGGDDASVDTPPGGGADPLTKGKGKKKGLVSPTDPV